MNKEYYEANIKMLESINKQLLALIEQLEERLAIKELSDDISKKNN